MAGQTFTNKQLRYTFTLANNATFAGTNSNVLKVTGLRSSTIVRGSGMPAYPEADITVYGMLQADMIALTALAFQPLALQQQSQTARNSVVVEANSDGNWTTIFSGEIITAGPDFGASPAASLKLFARSLAYESLNPTPPVSYTGSTSVATIVGNIASKMGYVLENNGVNAQLANPYFTGTNADQLRAVRDQAGIDVYVEGNVIAICNKGQPRNQPSWVLSPTSGLVGYPQFDYNRGFVNVKALFNAAFRFGGPVQISGSDFTQANGNWVIGTLTHTLDSVNPGGPWFTDMLLYPPGSLPPIQ